MIVVKNNIIFFIYIKTLRNYIRPLEQGLLAVIMRLGQVRQALSALSPTARPVARACLCVLSRRSHQRSLGTLTTRAARGTSLASVFRRGSLTLRQSVNQLLAFKKQNETWTTGPTVANILSRSNFLDIA